MAEPIISVIMTVYNGEQFLEQSIESILDQTHRDFEIVIVDDGSKDHTAQMLAKEAKKDARIRVILSHRLGRAKALNLALQSARGSYIANLDADDLAEPDRLEKQLAFLEQHPDVGLVGTARNLLNGSTKYVSPRQIYLTNKELRKALIRHMQFFHSSIMLPRHVLESVGGYNEDLRVAIDYDFCVRIACHYPVANLPQPLATKRIRPSSFFSKISSWLRYKTVIAIRMNAWKNFSGSWPELIFVYNPFGILDQRLKKVLRTYLRLFLKKPIVITHKNQPII